MQIYFHIDICSLEYKAFITNQNSIKSVWLDGECLLWFLTPSFALFFSEDFLKRKIILRTWNQGGLCYDIWVMSPGLCSLLFNFHTPDLSVKMESVTDSETTHSAPNASL